MIPRLVVQPLAAGAVKVDARGRIASGKRRVRKEPPPDVIMCILHAEIEPHAITLPIKIHGEANLREHWRVAARWTKAHRQIARECVRRWCMYHVGCSSDGKHLAPPLPLRVALTRIAPRALDDDGNTRGFKACRDGIADALGVNDKDPRVTWEYRQTKGKPREYAVRIEITNRLERT